MQGFFVYLPSMKPFLLTLCFLFTSFACSQEACVVDSTIYIENEYYTSGEPKVKRSMKNRKIFLASQGYKKVPEGYEVDHIIPLSQGGTDAPSNMQLLTKGEHKAKTKKERAVYRKRKTNKNEPSRNSNTR